jgi:hypothetical protein
MRYRCLRCGRDKFKSRMPHKCNHNFRKRHIIWQLLNDDGIEQETIEMAVSRYRIKRLSDIGYTITTA